MLTKIKSNPPLVSFLISLSFFALSACQTWAPKNYQFVYKYHPKIGGGVQFGVLDRKFTELNNEQIEELLKTSVIMPAKTWEMISGDIIKACVMLGKKCDSEVQIINGIFNTLDILNEKINNEPM